MYDDNERLTDETIREMGREYGTTAAIEAITSGDMLSDTPTIHPDEVEEAGHLAIEVYDEGYSEGVDAVRAVIDSVVEAYRVGRSHGDDSMNYALAYGETPRPEHPSDYPLWIERHDAALILVESYDLGWRFGAKVARQRHDDL